MNQEAMFQLWTRLKALRPGTPQYDAVVQALDEFETDEDRAAYADAMAIRGEPVAGAAKPTFPTGPEDVDTIRLTWLPGKVAVWCRGGQTLQVPPNKSRAKIEYWLAIRPLDLPLRVTAPDVSEEVQLQFGSVISFHMRATLQTTDA